MAAKQSPFGRITLITGPESLLADRAVEAIVADCRREDSTAELTDTTAERVDAGALATMSGGSLFATRSIAVIRNLADLDKGLFDAVTDLAADPVPELCLVLVHGGGNKGKGLLDKLKKLKVDQIDAAQIKPNKLPEFVNKEVRRNKARIAPDAVAFIVEAVGHDLRTLAGAISQLAADAEGEEITQTLAKRYFAGRAEVTSFAVAEAALAGNTTTAMEQLRWALATGAAPVLITSALARDLRALGKLASDRSGMGDNALAGEIGVPPWKIGSIRKQLRGWNQQGLAKAIQAVAQADADVKGASTQPEYSLERCVLAVTHARGR